MGAEAVRFIRAAPASEPFLLFVAFNAPHSPLQAPRVNLDAYGYDEEAGPFRQASSDRSKRRGRGNTVSQTYHAMISALDASIGAILAALDQRGMTRDSLVWFLSNNGANPRFGGSNEPLRGGKLSFWEGGVRVPAFIRWPAAGLSGGREVDALADVAAAHPDVVERLGTQLAAFKALAGPAKSVPDATGDPGIGDSWKIPAR